MIPQVAPRLQTRRNPLPGKSPRADFGRRIQANSGYIDADERWTRNPIQYGCCKVKIDCQNGNNGTRINHSRADVRIAHGAAARASEAGLSFADHLPSNPKKTKAQAISAH